MILFLPIYRHILQTKQQKSQNLIQIHPFKKTNKIKRAFSLRICSFAIFRIGLFSIYFYFHNIPNVVIDASLSDRQFGNLWASFLIHCHFPTLLKLIFSQDIIFNWTQVKFILTSAVFFLLHQFHYSLGPSCVRKHIHRLDIMDIIDLA